MAFSTRKLVALATAFALVAGMTGCSGASKKSGTETSTETKTVKIGFAAPLTGDNAVYGQGMQRADRVVELLRVVRERESRLLYRLRRLAHLVERLRDLVRSRLLLLHGARVFRLHSRHLGDEREHLVEARRRGA